MNQTIIDYDISKTATAKIIGRELLATAGSLVLLPFALKKSQHQTLRRAAQQRTVVLVHGYLSNRSALWPLTAYLRARGIKNFLSYEYTSSEGIERAAIGLKRFLKQRVRGGRIDLVCHSLGGLVSRVYLQDLGGARRVDRCITLGTPHLGTYNAYWVPSRVGQELRPDSSLLARLASTQGNAADVKFFSIIAGSDNIVIPRVFGRQANDVLHVPDTGHMGLLFSPLVFKAVAERLTIAS